MIPCDHMGRIILSSRRHLFSCTDALEAEMLAIKEGLPLALQWSNLPIIVESDCLKVVSMVKKSSGDRSRLSFIIAEINDLMKDCITCIAHIRRSQNAVSHYLVNFGRIHVYTIVWLGSRPGDVASLCHQDCNR